MSYVVQHTDVGMIQRGDRLSFAFESFLRFRQVGYVRWKNLDRNRAIQPSVAGLIHLTYPTRSQERHDLVMLDGFPHKAVMPIVGHHLYQWRSARCWPCLNSTRVFDK